MKQHKQYSKQQGMVLVIGLVLLVALTLIGITAMNMSKLEFTMAINSVDSIVSLQTAENAIQNGESNIPTSGDPGSNGIDPSDDADEWYLAADTVDPFTLAAVVNGTASAATNWTGGSGYADADSGGNYFIHYLGYFSTRGGSFDDSLVKDSATNKRYMYRVTSVGESGKGGQRFVQSYFANDSF